MTSDDFSKNDKTLLSATDQRLQRDYNDLQNELADRNVGRISRFFNDKRQNSAVERQRKHADTVELLTNLQTLLQDPDYAALYNEVSDLLARAEAATEQALKGAEASLAEAKDALSDTLDRAHQLPDGTKIFRDADGVIYTEDGRIVGEEEAAGIEWNDTHPSFEDYQKRQKSVEDAQLYMDQLRRYRVDLGDARNRLNDHENPPTKDELNDLKKDMRDGLDKISQDQITDVSTPENSHQITSEVKLPPLGG